MFGPPDSYNAPTTSTLIPDTYVLGSLPLGSRVRMHNINGELVVAGYLMMANVSRCSVYVTSEGDGNFIGDGEQGTLARIYKVDTNHTFQRESPVVWEGVDEEVRSVILEEDEERAETERGNRLLEYYIEEAVIMTESAISEMSPQARGIKARWDFQLRQMEKAIKAGDEPLLNRVRDILLSIAADADTAGVTKLTQPPASIVDDDVFDGIEQLVKTPSRAMGTNIGQPPAKVKANAGLTCHNGTVESFRAVTSIPPNQFGKGDGGREIEDRLRSQKMALGKKAPATNTPVNVDSGGTEQLIPRDQASAIGQTLPVSKAEQLKAIAAAKKAQGKEPPAKVTPKSKQQKVVGLCLDGCGGDTTAKFLPGHDARLKSLLIKIERGDEPLEALPEVVRAYVTFKKGTVEVHDIGGGKTAKVQLYTLTRSPVRIPGRNDIEFVEHR